MPADYELSLKNLIPMKVHLALDAMSGAALAAVPLATGARRRGLRNWLPHTLIGALEIGMALTTQTRRSSPRFGRLANRVRFVR